MSRVDESFDPAAHEMCEHKSFDELKVGDRFVNPSRTVGGENFAAFQLASGTITRSTTTSSIAGRVGIRTCWPMAIKH